jgi:catechol 2,3-dioxygenase-like lactoylglutathione lyase family enzyme
MEISSGGGTTVTGVHHVGASVASLDEAVGFWEAFLQTKPRFVGRLERPYLGESVGYPGVAIEAALFDLPGGGVLELLDYQVDGRAGQPEETFNPGHVHLCLRVDDCATAWRRAVDLGARPRRPDGPVRVDVGPNAGALVAYLRVHDGISVELYQPAL